MDRWASISTPVCVGGFTTSVSLLVGPLRMWSKPQIIMWFCAQGHKYFHSRSSEELSSVYNMSHMTGWIPISRKVLTAPFNWLFQFLEGERLMLFALPIYLLRQPLLISSFPLAFFLHSLTKIQFSDAKWHGLNTKGELSLFPRFTYSLWVRTLMKCLTNRGLSFPGWGEYSFLLTLCLDDYFRN